MTYFAISPATLQQSVDPHARRYEYFFERVFKRYLPPLHEIRMRCPHEVHTHIQRANPHEVAIGISAKHIASVKVQTRLYVKRCITVQPYVAVQAQSSSQHLIGSAAFIFVDKQICSGKETQLELTVSVISAESGIEIEEIIKHKFTRFNLSFIPVHKPYFARKSESRHGRNPFAHRQAKRRTNG